MPHKAGHRVSPTSPSKRVAKAPRVKKGTSIPPSEAYKRDSKRKLSPEYQAKKDQLKAEKKPGLFKRLKNWNEEDGGDKLGSAADATARLAGDPLDVSITGGDPGQGAMASIQYTKLDQEVDASQDKIRKQIQQLK